MNDRSIRRMACLGMIASFGLASCDNQKINVYQIPKEDISMQTGAAGLVLPLPSNPAKWSKPASWEEQPLSEMRLGSFKVVGKNGSSADISIIAFPGEAGGLASNVNRWRGQVQLPPLSEEELEQTTQRVEVEGIPVSLVDLSTPDNSVKPSRILGAVLERPDQTWFVKMMGDPGLLESQRQLFLDFVKSFRFAPQLTDDQLGTPASDKPRSTNDQ